MFLSLQLGVELDTSVRCEVKRNENLIIVRSSIHVKRAKKCIPGYFMKNVYGTKNRSFIEQFAESRKVFSHSNLAW